MIATSDFKKGTKILFRDEPYAVLDFQHVKPGKGGAFVRTKMKSMLTGLVREETFRSGEKLKSPDMEYHTMQFLYREDDFYHFMDQDSFDQVTLNKNQLGDASMFIKDEEVYKILYFNEKPIAVTPPMFIKLAVTDTPPGVKGDTAQGGGTKPATLETGLVVSVPLFVNIDDVIKVDTRENKYIERVS